MIGEGKLRVNGQRRGTEFEGAICNLAFCFVNSSLVKNLDKEQSHKKRDNFHILVLYCANVTGKQCIIC